MTTFVCRFCKNNKHSINSLRQHEIRCYNNPEKIKKGGRIKGKAYPYETYNLQNGATKAKLLNLPYVTYNQYTKADKLGIARPLASKSSNQTKLKISTSMKNLYLSGWECTAGRCKKYEYVSPIAGKIKIDGTWEYKFCEFADRKKLNWNRNNKRFKYIKPNGLESTYQPDFYVKELNSYIEVKGYETELDKAKWDQFTDNLIILRKKEIFDLETWYSNYLELNII